MSEFAVIEAEIDKLKVAEYNPRKISPEKMDLLKKSIVEDRNFLFIRPIIINKYPGREGVVIGGNQRYLAAKELGWKTIPAIEVKLTLEKEKIINIKDNQNYGEWDKEGLKEILKELSELNVDMDLTGFSSEEIEGIIRVIPDVLSMDEVKTKIKNLERKVQKGDIWQLGEHRLLCGDCSNENDVKKIMNGKKAQMCFTDPPYILNYLTKKCRKGKGFGMHENRRYAETTKPILFNEWMPYIKNIADNTFSIIVFENWKNIRELWAEMEKYWNVRNLIIWHCPNRIQGFSSDTKLYNKYDIALYGATENKLINLSESIIPAEKIEKGEFENEYDIAIWATGGKFYRYKYNKNKTDKYYCVTDHITYKVGNYAETKQDIIFGIKPIVILIPYIKVLTKKGDIVYEPFAGSGSTIIACEKIGRICYAIEKVPLHCDVIINRFERETNKKAIKIG